MPQARNTFERYLEDISHYPRIPPEREAELSHVIQDGGNEEQREAAIDELIHANLRLVVHCLKRFDGYLASPAVRITRMDLIAEGNIGLMKAAERFNANHACEKRGSIRFSTYACKCIQSQMHRAVKRSRFIHIPEHHFGYWSEMKALREEHGGDLSDEMLGKTLDVSNEVAGLLKQSSQSGICMLEDLVAHDTEGGGWSDFIPNESATCPAHETGCRDLRDFLCEEMEALPPRTQSMLSRLYLNDGSPTLRDLASHYNISSERCRQVCIQGLHHLRLQLAGRLPQIEPGMPVAVCAA
ncbi:MAG: sigma-70 family RNA polymerase sigma factor [Verrucomicrobia bacterium]|jgi:RNA polymerase primary sigma factor|nr:sigma-70 family RNA polymerase sigma factor [Verrucomicrobiota bacterium]MBT7068949.1 sigma-70 family RNA polymerase sigma factor [Verrucomicrobiota bacterium]MBT7701592.1 sigma-70 family RNA polymerase sigma factor [Verrucomicrobiota bacterium]